MLRPKQSVIRSHKLVLHKSQTLWPQHQTSAECQHRISQTTTLNPSRRRRQQIRHKQPRTHTLLASSDPLVYTQRATIVIVTEANTHVIIITMCRQLSLERFVSKLPAHIDYFKSRQKPPRQKKLDTDFNTSPQ